MNGIQSLMPGQAAPQGMPPGMPQGMPQGMQPQPSSPQQMMQSQTPLLESMNLDQLKQIFALEMSPGAPRKFDPSLVMAQISKAVEAERTRRALQMQQVQQQNAQQPPGTVAQQVLAQAQQLQMPEQQPQMQPPVMAAHGGAMHSYANGGAVAFRHGGNVQYFNGGSNEFGLMADPASEALDALRVEREQAIIAAKAEREQKAKQLKELEETYYSLMMQQDPRAAQVKQQLDVLTGRATASTAPAAAPRLTPQALESYVKTLASAPPPAPAPVAGPRRQPVAAPAPMPPAAQPAPAMQPAPAPLLSPEMENYYRNRASDLRTRQGLPEDVLVGRQGIAALAAQNLAAQRADAEQFGTEARQRRDEAMARAGRSLFSDPGSLLALAGSIDTRRGQALGSAARGLSGLMAKQEEARTAAGREYAQAQQTERMLQANVRQATMLEAQREQALREGDFNRANQIKDQIDGLLVQRETLLMERRDKAIEQARQAEQIKVQREQIASSERMAELNRNAQAALRNMPGPEQIMAERAIKSLMAANPSMPYHEAFDKVRGAGKGLEDKAEFANLRQQATMLRDELKMALESDPLGKSQRVADLRARLDGIYKQLGGTAPAAGGAVDRTNPLLK